MFLECVGVFFIVKFLRFFKECNCCKFVSGNCNYWKNLKFYDGDGKCGDGVVWCLLFVMVSGLSL